MRRILLCLLPLALPLPASAATLTWDGTTNAWNSAHWNPGPVAGGNNTNDTYAVGAGEVFFTANDTFGIHTTPSTPAVRIDAGGTISSGARFTTILGLNLNGGTLRANGGVNNPYGAFGLKGTVSVTGTTPSAIAATTLNFSTVSIGNAAAGTVTTFDVADVTGDPAEDLTVGAVFNNLGNAVSGLVKAGPGTMAVTTNLLNTGVNRVEGGVLRIGGSAPVTLAGGITTRSGGVLELTGVVNQGAGQIFATGNGVLGTTGTTVIRPGALVSVGGNAVLIGGGTGGNGQYGQGTLLIEAGGELVVGPGSATSGGSDATTIWLNPYGTSTNSSLRVEGTLRTARSIVTGGGTQAEVFANGGLVQFTADARQVNVSRLYIRNGGLQIDTQGFAASIASALQHSAVPGDSAIDGGLYKAGSGTLTLNNSGGTFTGNVTIGAGTVALGGAALGMNAAAGALGNSQVAGRAISVASGATLRFLSHDPLGNAGSAPKVRLVVDGGTLVSDGRLVTLGDLELNGATMTANGGVTFGGSNIGTWQLNGAVTVGGTAPSVMNDSGLAGSRILLRVTGGTTPFNVPDVTANGAADLVISTPIANGWNGTGAGIVKTGAGTLSLTATNLYTGVTDVHEGLLLVDGAVINSPGRMDIGLNAATPAHYQQNSGSVTVGTQFVIGAHGSTGAATVFDGTLRVNGTLYVGGYGEGVGTGSLEVNGGTVTATAGLQFGGGGPNNGLVDVNGGVLEVPVINRSGSGSSVLRFNGGLLRATASGTLIQGLTQASVRAGGARFDTGAFAVVVPQPLLHDPGLAADTPDGGLTKFGAGQLSLTGASTYTGPTAVSNGTLRLLMPFLHADSGVRVGAGAALFLDFSGTNTVATLDVAGVAQPAGLYGATASGVASPDDTHFGGTGVLRVLSGPTATPYQLWADASGLDGSPGHENGAGDDPDGDGAPNLSEFAVGSDPLDDASLGLFEVRAEDTLADGDALDELTLTLRARAGATFTADGAGLTAAVDGVRYRVDGSLDLVGFASGVEEVTPALGNTIPPSGYALHTFRLVASNGANGPGYLRLRVSDP